MAKVKLGEVAREYKATVKDAVDLPVVGLEHLIPGQVELIQWSEDADNTFTKGFKKGQMLFGRRRAYLKKAALAPFDGICSGDITVIEAIPERIMPELLPFVIQNDSLFDYAVEKSAGSLSPRVKWEHLKNYEFELPEMEHQRELVDLLWAMTRTKKAYQELVKQTYELVKSQFIEMFGVPAENAHGYEIARIGDVVCDVHYGTSKKASDDGEYTYLRMNNITYGGELDLTDTKRISISEKELAGCIVKKGDVLFNRTNSRDLVGKTCAFNLDEPMIIAGYIIRLRMNGRVLPEYLSTFLNLDSSKKMLFEMAKGAVGQANINAQEVQSIQIVVPPIEMQLPFQRLVEQSDKSKFELTQAISRIDDMIKALMQG